jgi:hypothetical protein
VIGTSYYPFKARTVATIYGIPFRLRRQRCDIERTQNPLDRICSPATIRTVGYPSFTKNLPTNLLPSGVAYEGIYSEGDNMKAPGDLDFPLEPF